MLFFLLTLFACGEDETEDTAADTSTETQEEAEATVRYH